VCMGKSLTVGRSGASSQKLSMTCSLSISKASSFDENRSRPRPTFAPHFNKIRTIFTVHSETVIHRNECPAELTTPRPNPSLPQTPTQARIRQIHGPIHKPRFTAYEKHDRDRDCGKKLGVTAAS
jgi:hypothetical protein